MAREDGADRVAPGYVEVLQQIESAQEIDVVEQALTAARERLGMDAAYLTTVDAEHQTVNAVVGDPEGLGLTTGSQIPIETTYCARMLRGEIPNLVPDTRLEPALRDLDATRDIASYIGVPVRLSGGRVHGTLCCTSHTLRGGLGVDEVGFMMVLAGIVAVRLDEAQGNVERLTARFRDRQSPPGV